MSTFVALGGGNALGAYDAGAIEALVETGERIDWIAGASIGAVTAVIFAGNPPELRLERLREYWKRAASSGPDLPGALMRPAQLLRALETRILGRPSMFHPELLGLFSGPERKGLYDSTPLRKNLLDLVDFGRVNGGAMRVSLTAVDLTSGEEAVFDTTTGRIEVDHVLASAALIPDFSPVRIGDRLFVDGGLANNVPADVLLAETPASETACFAIDPFPRGGRVPAGYLDLSERQSDLSFACQTARSMRALDAIYGLRRQLTARDGGALPAIELIRLQYTPGPEETTAKAWDFGKSALARRWAAGRADMRAALSARAERTRQPGLSIHTVQSETGEAARPTAA